MYWMDAIFFFATGFFLGGVVALIWYDNHRTS
jgi:hypothetical protein